MNQIRSIVTSGSVPTVNQLALGDIAINTVDGRAYIKKYSGSVQSIVDLGLSASYLNPLHQDVYLTGSLNISGSEVIKGYIELQPVTTNIDTTKSASYIYVSGSTNDLYFSQNGDGYNNVTRLRWLEGNLYTGLLNGGIITTASSTTFNLSSGSGIIVSLNASINSNPYPTVKYINWGNFTGQTLTYRTSSIQTFIGIDATGSIIQKTSPWIDGEYNTSISIGTVLHQNKSTINAQISYPNVAYGYKQRTYDFIKAFGPLKLSGYTLFTSSSLGLTVGSGTAFADGRNYQVDPNNPSYITDAGTNISKIFRYYQSGSEFVQDTNGGAGYTVIDPANYNPNGSGSLTTTSPSKFTIQRVFYYPNSATKGIVVYYGNTEYGTLEEGVANIAIETFNEVENTKQNAVYLGAIVIKGNATFTGTDYQIVAGGLFRASVGGGAGGGGGGSALPAFPFTGSAEITGSLLVIGPVTASAFSGSFTGSFSGSGTITSASFSQTASFLNPLSQTVRLTGSLVVTGSVIISSSATFINVGPASFTGSAGTGSALAIYKSGSNVLSIDGSSGRLFSVDDSLSGSLFSVNTAAGLPVIEAFSDNTVNIGKYGSYPLSVSGSTLRATGSFTGSFNGNLSGSANLTSLTASGALINGNVTINGTASISFLNVSIESASVIYSTGSNQLGDAANDTQTLFGSVIIPTGSLIVSGALQVSSSANSYIIGSGSVGIGTASPQRELHVDAAGSANVDTPLLLTSVNTVSNRVGILFASSSLSAGKQHYLFHRVNGPTAEWLLGMGAGETGIWRFLPQDNNNYGVSLLAPYNGGTVYLTTGLSQSLFSLGAGGQTNQHINISSSGWVGVRTTSPVSSDDIVTMRLDRDASTALTIVNGNNSANSRSHLRVGAPGTAISLLSFLSNYTAVPNVASRGVLTTDSSLTSGLTLVSSAGPISLRPDGFSSTDLLTATGSFVGIGTTTPTTRLHVKGSGTTSSTTALRVENSSAAARLTVLDDGTAAFNTSQLYISSSGKISVGSTVNAGYALEVYDTGIYYAGASSQAQFLITTSGSLGSREGAFITSGTGRTVQLGIADNSAIPVGIDMFETNNSFPSTYINFRVNNADLVRMTGSFVGIGTTSPQTTLDVSGSGRFTNGLNVTGSTSVAGIITQLDILNALPAYYQIINLPSSIPGGGGAPTSLISIPSGQPVSMFIEYQIINTATMTDQRSGTIMANFNSSGTPTSTFTETVTADIGNTAGVVFTTNVGAFYDIQATNAGVSPYTFKAILRYF